MVAQYYWVVRCVAKEKPHLRKCLTRCRHCHILFFTHPRNAGRNDLGCPFGCRQAHRRKSSIHRSTEYYQSEEGKQKKKYLNAGRSQQNRLPESRLDEKGNDDCGSKFDGATVSHIQMVTSCNFLRRNHVRSGPGHTTGNRRCRSEPDVHRPVPYNSDRPRRALPGNLPAIMIVPFPGQPSRSDTLQ